MSFVYATEWNTNSKSNFSDGSYNQTESNSTGFVNVGRDVLFDIKKEVKNE